MLIYQLQAPDSYNSIILDSISLTYFYPPHCSFYIVDLCVT